MLATDLKKGTVFKENGVPYLVVQYAHTKVARGGATVKVKAKDLTTGNVYEKGYKGSAKIEDADIRRKNAQYIYEQNGYVFMDPDSYQQFTISEEIMGDDAKFLKEGESVQVLYFEDNPIAIDLPITMTFEVTYTEPGFKGNTVTNTLKDATVDNGATVKVPTFIKIGDMIKVDTRSGEYVSKA